MQRKSLIHILGIYLLLMIVLPKSLNNIAGIIPVRLLLGFLYVLIFVVYKIKTKDTKISNKKYLILAIIFLLSLIPSVVKSASIVTSLYSVLKYGLALTIFISILNLNITKDDLKILFKYLVGGLIIVIIYGIIQYIFKIDLTTIGAYNYPGSIGRISATFFNTIYFSIFLNMMICLFTYLISKCQNKKNKIISIILLVCSYICMLLTFTRSAVLIFSGCLIITMIFNHKIFFTKTVLITYLLMIGLSFAIPGVPTLYYRTFGDITGLVATNETDDPSLDHRMEFSKIGIKLGKDYFPTGIGLGSFEEYVNSKEYEVRYPQYIEYKTHPHSSVILLFTEASIWPLLSLAAMIIVLAIDLLKIWFKNPKNELSHLAVLTATILGGFFIVNVIAENAIYDSQIFPIFLIFLGGLLGHINEVKLCQK